MEVAQSLWAASSTDRLSLWRKKKTQTFPYLQSECGHWLPCSHHTALWRAWLRPLGSCWKYWKAAIRSLLSSRLNISFKQKRNVLVSWKTLCFRNRRRSVFFHWTTNI